MADEKGKEKERLRRGGAPPGVPHVRWRRVIEAKEFLEQQSTTYAKLHLTAIKRAIKEKDFETALKATEWALSHLSSTDDSGKEVRPVASSVDKQVEQQGSSQPQIVIGFRVGGLPLPETPQITSEPAQKALEPPVITVESEGEAKEADITSVKESES